jgi:hypothetical protein
MDGNQTDEISCVQAPWPIRFPLLLILRAIAVPLIDMPIIQEYPVQYNTAPTIIIENQPYIVNPPTYHFWEKRLMIYTPRLRLKS